MQINDSDVINNRRRAFLLIAGRWLGLAPALVISSNIFGVSDVPVTKSPLPLGSSLILVILLSSYYLICRPLKQLLAVLTLLPQRQPPERVL